MKLVVKWASDYNKREEWDIDTIESLLQKAKEHGDLIIRSSASYDYQIEVYDDYIE